MDTCWMCSSLNLCSANHARVPHSQNIPVSLSCLLPPRLVRRSCFTQWFPTLLPTPLNQEWPMAASQPLVWTDILTVAVKSHSRVEGSVPPREADRSTCQFLLEVSEIRDWDIWIQVSPCPWSSHHALPRPPRSVYWWFPWSCAGWTKNHQGWIKFSQAHEL